jgi:hypothetical protein
MIIELILQVLLVTIVLVLLGGVSQMLPLGTGSAKVLRQTTTGSKEFGTSPDRVTDLTATPAVTAEFDRIMPDRVSTLTTDRSFSWIVSRPIAAYNPGRYFALEIATQLLVAIGLVTLSALLSDSSAGTRIVVAAIAALLTSIAAYGQLANWWGLTLRYVAGVSLTLIVGWTLSVWLITLVWD